MPAEGVARQFISSSQSPVTVHFEIYFYSFFYSAFAGSVKRPLNVCILHGGVKKILRGSVSTHVSCNTIRFPIVLHKKCSKVNVFFSFFL